MFVSCTEKPNKEISNLITSEPETSDTSSIDSNTSTDESTDTSNSSSLSPWSYSVLLMEDLDWGMKSLEVNITQALSTSYDDSNFTSNNFGSYDGLQLKLKMDFSIYFEANCWEYYSGSGDIVCSLMLDDGSSGMSSEALSFYNDVVNGPNVNYTVEMDENYNGSFSVDQEYTLSTSDIALVQL